MLTAPTVTNVERENSFGRTVHFSRVRVQTLSLREFLK